MLTSYLLSRPMWDTQSQKLWSSGRALGSQSESRGFKPHPMLDGRGVKAMVGSIRTPSSGSLQKNKKMQVAKWGTPKNYFKTRGV